MIGDLGNTYNTLYAAMSFVTFLLVFIMLLSAIIRIIDRR